MDRIDRWQAHIEALTSQTEHLEHQTQALEAHTQAREAQTPMVERRRRWAVRAVLLPVATLLGAIGIMLWSVTSAHADGIQCGDVLGPGGRFELEHDLECQRSPAVTVRDGAILDLNGHIVSCRLGLRCVVLTGTGAQLLNGAVQGSTSEHESISLEGAGWHTVRNVTSTLVDANIQVRSDHNQLINVMAESANNSAFDIIGNHNRLTDSIARCIILAFGGCIDVIGNENRLINNFVTATGSPGHGFIITGDNNVLRGNRAIRNDSIGIIVTGTGNNLQRNTALGNSLDLRDTNGDCAHNTWRQNTFRTSDPACIRSSTEESVADLER